MATDVGSMPNGSYAPHQAYSGIDQNSYSYNANAATSQLANQQPVPASSTASVQQLQQPEISKDEVGWYFVEQYYTTLSRSPERLYLFYNKRSQFVSGPETDKVQVCIGQRAINDKIRELDFQDCKVRVTNVDSQASDSNIVIQVIGEISNKGQPHRKFTQTFVLATQTNGYFVLNDIFRYLIDEEGEPEQEAPLPTAEDVRQAPGTENDHQEPLRAEAEPNNIASSTKQVTVEHEATNVTKEIEEKSTPSEPVTEQSAATAAAPVVNGQPVAEVSKKDEVAPTVPEQEETVVEAEPPSDTVAETTEEKAKEAEPAPVPSPPKQAPSQPAPAPKPAAPLAPMTWAGRAAAANRVATPVAPPLARSIAATATSATAATVATVAKPVTPVATSAVNQPSTSAPTAPLGPAAQRQDTPDSQDDWNTVGHNRLQSRQANTQQPELPQHRGYIKNVHESIDAHELRSALEKFGEVIYFDISRQKNCAFVDFKTADGYNKATSTPIKIGEEDLVVEERRMRPGSTPYIPRGNFGGRGRGGAGGQGPPRGNFQNNRGQAAPRGARGGYQSLRGTRGGGQA